MVPRVALIMPARDEEGAVDETMASILASTRMPDEIIVADGLSRDRTVEKVLAYRARGLDVKVVSNPAMFPGAGRNAGARATDCDILLFADFGNRIEPDWVASMVAALTEDPRAEAVTGLYYTLPKSDFEHCVACINYPKLLAFERATPDERRATMAPIAAGGSIGCRRDLWRRIGGFPDWLRTAEDKLFARKLARGGVRVAHAWNAAVRHHMRPNARAVFWQHFHYGRGDGQTRFVNSVSVKLLAIHGALLGLIGLAAVSPLFPAMAAALFALYAYGAAIRKVVRHDGRLRRAAFLLHAPRILLARDWGTLGGTAVGWLDWLLVPMYRRRFWDYVGEPTSPPRAPDSPYGLRAHGRFVATAALAGALALTILASSTSNDFAGSIQRVVDGDTLAMGDVVFDLYGIDAPELTQNCGHEARRWWCGEAARVELERMVAGKRIVCRLQNLDDGGRMVASCRAGGTDLAAALVEAGLALTVEPAATVYASLEAEAKQAQRGIWAGPFTAPASWRDGSGR